MPSSVISSYHYDEAKQALIVVFVSGMVYEYQRVPLQVYQAMENFTSKGIFLNTRIKGKYKFVKVA